MKLPILGNLKYLLKNLQNENENKNRFLNDMNKRVSLTFEATKYYADYIASGASESHYVKKISIKT